MCDDYPVRAAIDELSKLVVSQILILQSDKQYSQLAIGIPINYQSVKFDSLDDFQMVFTYYMLFNWLGIEICAFYEKGKSISYLHVNTNFPVILKYLDFNWNI